MPNFIPFGSLFTPGSSLPYTPMSFQLAQNLVFRVNWQDIIGRPTLFPYDFNVLDTSDIDMSFNSGTSTLSSVLTITGVTAGVFGGVTKTFEIEVDTKGRVLDILEVDIQFPVATVADTTYIDLDIISQTLTATLLITPLYTLLDARYWKLDGNTVVAEKWFGTVDNFSIPLKINSTGIGIFSSVGVGLGAAFTTGTTPLCELEVSTAVSSTTRGIMSSQYGAFGSGARFHFNKARGIRSAPVTINSGDNVGLFAARAYEGTAFIDTANIIFGTSGTIGTSRTPGTITFMTATDASPSVLTTALFADAAQNIGIGSSSSLASRLTVRGVGTSTSSILLLQNGTPSSIYEALANGQHTWNTGLRLTTENAGLSSVTGGEIVFAFTVLPSTAASSSAFTAQWRLTSPQSWNQSSLYRNYAIFRMGEVQATGTGAGRFLWASTTLNGTATGDFIDLDLDITETAWGGAHYGVLVRGATARSGLGLVATMPTSRLQIASQTTAASTSPLKYTSGASLMGATEIGAHEFSTPFWYYTPTATAGDRRPVSLAGVNTQSGTSYTVLDADIGKVINMSNTAARTMTLPAVATVPAGYPVWIKDSGGNAGTNNIVISPAAGTIDGSATLTLNVNYQLVGLYHDTTNWFIS